MTRTTGAAEPGVRASVDRVAIVKIDIEARRTNWTCGLTLRYPVLTLEIDSILPLGRGSTIGDYHLLGPRKEWAAEIARFPDVETVAPLDEGPYPTMFRVRFRASILSRLMVRDQVVLRYPASVQNGILTIETIDRISRIRSILQDLQRAKLPARLGSLRRVSPRHRLPQLSPVQRILLDQAVSAGYFAVPRRINLTRLAQKMGRSKSTVSKMLAVVEEKLVAAALETDA
jgi:predicted DNA binding protein